jgi:hypothetical protein
MPNLDDVAGDEDDDRAGVFADLCMGLVVEVRSGDEDSGLTVAQAGDEPAGFVDPDDMARCVAFGFACEPHGDGFEAGTEQVVADDVASAVVPGRVTSTALISGLSPGSGSCWSRWWVMTVGESSATG